MTSAKQPSIERPEFKVFASGLDHPECVAIGRDGEVWAGGEAGQIYRIDPGGAVTTVATLGGFVAGIAFSPLDRALYICNSKLGLFRVDPDGRHGLFATAAAGHKLVCPNYPVFDRRGRLYVSDSGKWKQNNGFLLRFDPDGTSQVIGGPFGYANGLALSADGLSGEGGRLFMVESDRDRVLVFEIGSQGVLGPAQVYAEAVGRLPDGLTLDEKGNLYVACYASDEIWRISPTGQRTLIGWDHYAIVISRPTNLAFGGEQRDVLYVANLGRDSISRGQLPGVRGQRLAHQL